MVNTWAVLGTAGSKATLLIRIPEREVCPGRKSHSPPDFTAIYFDFRLYEFWDIIREHQPFVEPVRIPLRQDKRLVLHSILIYICHIESCI